MQTSKTFLKYFLILGLFASCNSIVYANQDEQKQYTTWTRIKSFCNKPNVKRVACAAAVAGLAGLVWVINKRINPGAVSQTVPTVCHAAPRFSFVTPTMSIVAQDGPALIQALIKSKAYEKYVRALNIAECRKNSLFDYCLAIDALKWGSWYSI